MADEKEKVLYEFRGDVSSLRKATTDAIGMLDKFQGSMDKLNSEGIVKASQRAQTGFQNSVNKMIKGVDAVQKKLSSVGDVRMPRGTEAFNATKQASETLASTLDKLNSSNTITSKTLKSLKDSLNVATSGLKEAGPSFDNLIAKEQKFQKRLESVTTTASKFSSGIQGATSKVKNTFDNMGNSVGATLRSIGDKFSPLTSRIQGFQDKAIIAGNRVAHVFASVSEALRRTASSSEGAAASQDKMGKTLDGVGEKFNKNSSKLDKNSKEFDELGEAAMAAGGKMSKGALIAKVAFGKLGDVVRNVVGGITDAFFAMAGVQVGDLLSQGAKGAIDYVENFNLFTVAMGSSIDKGHAFVNQMQEVYGMDPSNLYRYAGYFYQLTDAIGMSAEASSAVSLSMTKAANDIASLFNQDIETVVENLSSGMMGMSRAVKKYGMDIRTTTLQQTAFKYGLTDEVETMSEANRQALRYITMLDQANNALHQTIKSTDGASEEMGDFARNIETPANQLRIFKEQMSQLGRAIGNFIVYPISIALPYINGFVMALRTVINAVAALTGVTVKSGSSLDEESESIEKLGAQAGKVSKKIKQLIAPFDELNVLQQDSGSADTLLPDDALDPTLAKALSEMELNLENITMKANKVRDSILEFLGLKITNDPITGEQIIQWDKNKAFESITSWLDTTPGKIALVISALGLLGQAFMLGIPIKIVGIAGLIIAALGLLVSESDSFREAFIQSFEPIKTSLSDWGTKLIDIFKTVGTDMSTMWSTHMQPTIAAIGDSLAPALETLGNLWTKLSTVVSDALTQTKNTWTTVLKPALEAAMEIIQDLCDIIEDLWTEYVDPVIAYIGDGVADVWKEKIKPVIDKVITILGKLIELIKALWKNPLKPIIEWLVKIFGPAFVGVFKTIWDVIKQVINDISDVISGLLTIIEGIIDFLVGVFTGDWERAWKGLVNIFVGIGNTLISIFETVVNAIISLINSLIESVWQGIQGLVNTILGAVEGIAEFLGKDLDIRLNARAPKIPALSIPRIPEMAQGGVVTGPTQAIIGEGRYDEAVIPLDDSPQMNDLINKIVEAIDKDDDPDPQPVEVRVYIGDKEYDAYTYKASERGKKIVGKRPIKIGG